MVKASCDTTHMRNGLSWLRERAGTILIIVALFVAVSYLAQTRQEALASAVGESGVFGFALYVLLMAAFVVFVIPLELVLLVPLGAALWGAVPTALLSIAGWTLGAGIAFFLARRFGKPFVARIVGEQRLAELERRVPLGNTFWSVIFLRMSVPVDLLSYALGLFGTLTMGRYLAATVLGVMLFAFFFAYAGTLPLWYQLGALALAGVVVMIALVHGARRK